MNASGPATPDASAAASGPAARPWWLRYSVALVTVLLALLAREAIGDAVGLKALPFTLFFPAIAVAAWYGGLGPGLFSLVLSALAADWFFFEPVHSLALRQPLPLLIFIAVSAMVVGIIESMHRARARMVEEIAHRLRSEQQAVATRDLLATTLASIGDGVIATDADGRATFLNPEAERLTGWKSNEALGKTLPNFFRIMDEQTRQPAESPVEQVLRQGRVVGLANHTILIAKDGREIPIDDSAAPIRHAGGALSGVVLVFRDVALERKAQLAQARLAAIVEFSGDVILTKDLQGTIQSWNASAQRLFGYEAAEVIGKPVTILFPPDRLNEEDYILGRLRDGKPAERLETIRLAKDGRAIPVLVSVSPLKDASGQVVGASKIIHDISDIVAAREALAREKEVLATTLASIGDAVVVTDVQGRVVFLNAEAERLTGFTRAEAPGRPLQEIFRIVNEQTRQPVEDPVAKVLRLGTVVGLANHTILLHREGREIPIDDSAAPIRQPGGPLFGIVLVFRDFTERKRAEQALNEAHAALASRAVHLEKLVRERTAKLQEMVAELQHVSYAITHDMRAPLRAMNTFAALVLEQLSSPQPTPEAGGYCRRIIAASNRLDQLIQDSLKYTKAVLQPSALRPVDLSRLLQSLIETYPNLQPDKADITIADPLPVVLGEESLLTQCFSNLLGNAVKFVAPGTRPQIHIRASTSDGVARITVEDNGIGLPPHAEKRLFGMFERFTGDYEGTGIGLAIVRKVVERMGGRVGADSQPGQGSRFWVELRTPSVSETAPQGTASSFT